MKHAPLAEIYEWDHVSIENVERPWRARGYPNNPTKAL